MKNLNPLVQQEILDRTYVSANDLYQLYPISKQTAYMWVRSVVNDLIKENIPLMPGTPTLIPLERILKDYPLNKEGIRRAAKRKEETK